MKQAYVTLQIDTTKAQALDKMVLYAVVSSSFFSIRQIVKQPGKGGEKRLGDVTGGRTQPQKLGLHF